MSSLPCPVSRLPSLAFAVGVVAFAPVAHAQTLSCAGGGDAPAAYDANTCNNVCAEVNNEWVCDLAVAGCSNSFAKMVQDYNATGNHDFSAWGTCGGVGNWCCTFDDPGAPNITAVRIKGTPGNDDFSFIEGVADFVRPHAASDLLGFITGGDGNDGIDGSDYIGNDYRDNLYGGSGADGINGGADKDWIDGGPGDDECAGDGGNDRIIGGPGDDYLEGHTGHDVLCDTADDSASGGGCVTSGGTFFDSGPDNDKIWYDGEVACPGRPMDNTSTAGAGNGDTCGDTAWATLPGACESPTLVAAPAECTDPN